MERGPEPALRPARQPGRCPDDHPGLRALKEAVPERRIALLTSPQGAEAAALVPEVDEVLVYQAPWMKATAPLPDGRSDLQMAERLREDKFEGAVVFTVYSQNPLPAAFLCHLAGIPLRLGHCRENPYQLFTQWVAETEPEEGVRHEVRRQLDLVAAIGCRTANERISVRVRKSALRRVGRLLRGLGLEPKQPWVVVHPGASAPSRRYPEESYAAAARGIFLELECPVVFTGSAAERELVDSIQKAMGVPSFSLAGSLSLEELAALISLSSVLISNNTGPVHVAAGVGTPVVDLYALTNPQHTPWGVESRVLSHDVPCKYCYRSICPEGHHQCLRLVSPEAVVQAVRELLPAGAGALGAFPVFSSEPGLSVREG